MRIAVLGATGRTGRLVIDTLHAGGHDVRVLVRKPDRLEAPGRMPVVTGDTRDIAALRQVVDGVDAVISALGPAGRDPGLMSQTATALSTVMGESGVSRFVGVGVAGLTIPGDRKGPRDAAISWVMNTFGGQLAADRRAEYDTWKASTAQWTLLRVPRLVNAPAGRVTVDAHTPGRRATLSRASLAQLLVSETVERSFVRAAPFVSDATDA
ncbi:NAD(P)-dependent oxidoreductase [Microbacterium sp. 3J1]|uniref:NAD(P)-dependent oxidoreductase n=1 Tax=Microbacterium sp. 3J1 TaxID=861269 RepID=UPI000A7C89FD|nr:NAD(P)-binding oxidoreductase [Microbacterium sp. 3J1]